MREYDKYIRIRQVSDCVGVCVCVCICICIGVTNFAWRFTNGFPSKMVFKLILNERIFTSWTRDLFFFSPPFSFCLSSSHLPHFHSGICFALHLFFSLVSSPRLLQTYRYLCTLFLKKISLSWSMQPCTKMQGISE